MQGTLPLDLLKLGSRLQEILGLLESGKPSATVAAAVGQFVTDYSHDEGGPCALFHEDCKTTWERAGDFYGTHIFRCDELSSGRTGGKEVLGSACEATLRFVLDSKCAVDWQKHAERLREALRRYLSLRGHDVKGTSPTAKPDQGGGKGGAKEGDTADATAATAKAPAADGPIPPDAFLFDGHRFDGLARQPFLALQYLWTQPSRAATKEDLAEPVFGDTNELVTKGQLHNIRRDLNEFFRSHRLPFTARVANGYLTVEQVKALPPPRKPAKTSHKPVKKSNPRRSSR
jgi:hypothetical protein